MGHPTGGEVSVATNTLRSEAGDWDTASDQMTALSAKTGGMQFGRLEAGIFQLMVGPYNDLVELVTSHCRDGATAMTGIGQTLREVADRYDAQDKAAADRIHKTN